MKYILFVLAFILAASVYGRRSRSNLSPHRQRQQVNEQLKKVTKPESAKNVLNAKENNGFHLQRSYSENDKCSNTGVIVVTGNTYLLSLVSRDNKIKISTKKKEVHMRGATRRGGQSAPRFGRINTMNKKLFLKSIAEDAYKKFTHDGRPVISNLVIAGIAQGKDKLKSLLHKSLQNLVSNVSTVNKDGEAGLNLALKKLETKGFNLMRKAESEALDQFFSSVQAADERWVYNFDSVIEEIEQNNVKKVIVYENLDRKRCKIRDTAGKERFEFMTNEEIKNFNKDKKRKHIKEQLVEPHQELEEYIEEKFEKTSVIRISEETIKEAKYEHFVSIYGGVAAFLHMENVPSEDTYVENDDESDWESYSEKDTNSAE